MRVLVVEDDAIISLMLEDAVAGAGHSVIGPAESAATALLLAEKHQPDLALLDIELRGAPDGIYVAQELLRRGTPSMFLTGQVSAAYWNRWLALGLIRKPYRPETVLAGIDAAETIMKGYRPSVQVLPKELDMFYLPG